MIEELNNKIIDLQDKLARKERDHQTKKQNYEAIIKDLQEENQRLKSLLADDSMSHEDLPTTKK